MSATAVADAAAPHSARRGSGSAEAPSGHGRLSLVQQKLQNALQDAERTSRDLTVHRQPTRRASLSAILQNNSDDDPPPERAVVRYRQAAAAVSFTDQSTAFRYTPHFMPGVHFYTFLGSKDTSESGKTSPTSQQARGTDSGVGDSQPSQSVRPRSAGASRSSSARPPLRMWIPDTVVYGETGRAVWIYNDANGLVQRSTEFTDKQVLDRFTELTATEGANLIAFKEPITSTPRPMDGNASAGNQWQVSQGNQLRLLSIGELKTLLSSVASTTRRSFAIQRLVRCSGAKAFVLRSVYDVGKPAYAWMISNTVPIQDPTAPVSTIPLATPSAALTAAEHRRTSAAPWMSTPMSPRSQASQPDAAASSTAQAEPSQMPSSTVSAVSRLCTSVQSDRACTFVKLNERACAATSELTLRVVKHVELRLGVQLQALVADFTKDTDGKWWLLQVKAFQVKCRAHPGRPISLPLRLRLIYMGYRDSQFLEDGSDSDGEDGRRAASNIQSLLLSHRQTRKLMQCKCCLAAYPKSELAFKMTLKMINDMLLRIRSRTPPEISLTFLAPALARDPPEAALAYETWSVCSFCYAIYERDQQLQRVEAKFSTAIGIPSAKVAALGLSRVHENRNFTLDQSASTNVLPPQLTLCRLVLVINGIYDVPPELYDAETSGYGSPGGISSRSRLFLRITALGYTECVPIDPEDIVVSTEKAPRGAVRRKSNTLPSIDVDGDDDDDEGYDTVRRLSRQSTSLATQRESNAARNYTIPLNLLRTIQFFAPRTPLQSKLKETSGISPFLTDDNSIHIQLIRATDPPLDDPTMGQQRRRPNKRRAALIAEPLNDSSLDSGSKASPRNSGHSSKHNRHPTHTVVLGSTKIRMAQFQSAYVTKIDYYACMAFSGELLNVKGNVGLERLRYVDTKLLSAQTRLRTFNGVYVPDDTYTAADSLSPEWMDCLRLSLHQQSRRRPSSEAVQDVGGRADRDSGKKRNSGEQKQSLRSAGNGTTTSRTSLAADDEEMDHELEEMIDHENRKLQQTHVLEAGGASKSAKDQTPNIHKTKPRPTEHVNIDKLKSDLLSPPRATSSGYDASVSALMSKAVISPRSALCGGPNHTPSLLSSTGGASIDTANRLWTLVIHLNQAHNLQSREHAVCRWECSYSLFGQKRSGIERRQPRNADGSPRPPDPNSGVQFTCTHKFFVAGSPDMMRAFINANPRTTLQLRNDMYASTRLRRDGEFYCVLELTRLLSTASFDTTLDISLATDARPVTPREAAAMAQDGAPYLSVSVQISDSEVESEEGRKVLSEGFVEVGTSAEGLSILRKM